MALLVLLVSGALAGQTPERAASDAEAERVKQRIGSLLREAERLSREARTLVGDVRKLEIERDLRTAEAQRAEGEAERARQEFAELNARVTALEEQRTSQLPDLKTQLVEVYKRGRGQYARLLVGANDLREFARAARAVAALSSMNERRLAEHRQTLESLERERAALEETTKALETRRVEAVQARMAAERAVRQRTQLLAQIDSRRDLTAQYAGELQVVYERLQAQVADASSEAGARVTVPIAPFRGELDWPVSGRVLSRFGQTAGRLGGFATRNGVELAATEGAVVRAVHPGEVAYADVFTGFGTLVILEHGGNNHSLYGYLATSGVQRGDSVARGAELGRVGTAPSGEPALYFEMRVDGRSVDPLQWLDPR